MKQLNEITRTYQGEQKCNPKTFKKKHSKHLELYLKNCETQNKSLHTIKNYRCDLEKYIYFFEQAYPSHKLWQIGPTCIELYKAFMAGEKIKCNRSFWQKILLRSSKTLQRERPLKISAQKRHLSTVKNFYDFLVQYFYNGPYKDNPVKAKLHAIKLKDIDVEHTKLINPSQWYLIEQAPLDHTERLIAHLLYFGGLRLQELTSLKRDDFSRANKTLTCVRKGGDIHTFKLQEFDYIYRELDGHMQRGRGHQWLFVNKLGYPISSRQMYNKICKILQKAGLSHTSLGPHSFRKACATNLYKKNKDLLLVRDYLNHKDAKVTQTYIEL